MMSKKLRFLGFSSLVTLAVAGGATMWLASEGAISTPSLAASSNGGISDPAPQRFQIAQAQSGAKSVRAGSSLPGGASSLTETYRDWRVDCLQQDAARRCSLSQIQVQQQNGQRVLAIELSATVEKMVSGTLALPFGLALDSGVTFQVDDKQAMQPVRFRTCLPAGCLVDVTFDASTLDMLRAGSVLKVNTIADGGATAPFSISLQGFGTALDRVEVLSR